MLRLENVSHSFKNGNEVLKVLHNIQFEVQKGEMIALLGSSGSGKSTLLNLMAGLMKPTEGHIYIADQDIVKYGKTSLPFSAQAHRIYFSGLRTDSDTHGPGERGASACLSIRFSVQAPQESDGASGDDGDRR